MIPRVSERTALILTFRTFVQPADSGPLGVLSLDVPGLGANVSAPVQAQVGSGEQTLRVGLIVDCRQLPRAFTTDQVVVTLRSNAGRELLSQTFQYFKAWCY